MNEASVVIPGSTNNNLSDSGTDWWNDVSEEEVASSLPLDGSEYGLWNGNFVPPPPRPIFLDDGATPDGLTTCDLCTWAWKSSNSFTLDAAMEAPGELGWVLTLVIVSLISAVVGAIVMIIVLHCKRMKSAGLGEPRGEGSHETNLNRSVMNRPPINTPDNKAINGSSSAPFMRPRPSNPSSSSTGVWSWLSRRSTSVPSQLASAPPSAAENHYTHMEEPYNAVEEALYAELDRESAAGDGNHSPAYQNSAYADPDAPVSSAPSSAYYSDLSVTTMPERAYEVVGLSTLPVWDSSGTENKKHTTRLAAISENTNVPSDYV